MHNISENTFKAFLRLVLGKRWLSNRVLLLKALVYRMFSVCATFLITFVITGNLEMSMTMSVLDLIGKTLLYYLFDVGWNNLRRKL